MSNEAAERLRSFLNTRFVPGHPENHAADLDAALAAERRATVERIQARLPEAGDPISWTVLMAILDSEAER